MIEIGCGEGGSLPMWKAYFGPHARIVGLDIRPECTAFKEDQIEVRIGDQSDPEFLSAVYREFGAPDILLDDGSHQMPHVQHPSTIYIRRCDQIACTWSRISTPLTGPILGGLGSSASFIETSKNLIDQIEMRITSETTNYYQMILLALRCRCIFTTV